MGPPISQFPAEFFYNKNLEDHPSVAKDNSFRKLFRHVTKLHYDIKGPDVIGSELIGINVRKGRSAGVAEGTSAYDIANAMAIAQFAIHLLMVSSALPAQDIVVLIYYAGQYEHIVRILKANAPNDEIREKTTKIRIFTVDKYQGEQAQYILLDITVSRPAPNVSDSSRKRKGDGMGGTMDAPIYVPDFHLSTHMKEPGRICCAITRARSGLAIFCNFDTCAVLLKQGVSRKTRALAQVLLDLQHRDLMYDDEKTVEPGVSTQEWNKRLRENKTARQSAANNELYTNRAVANQRQPNQSKRTLSPRRDVRWDEDDNDAGKTTKGFVCDPTKKDPWASDDWQAGVHEFTGKENVGWDSEPTTTAGPSRAPLVDFCDSALEVMRDAALAQALQQLEDQRADSGSQLLDAPAGREGQTPGQEDQMDVEGAGGEAQGRKKGRGRKGKRDKGKGKA